MAKGEHAEHAGAAYLPLWTAGWHTEFVPETGKCLPLREVAWEIRTAR